MAAAKYIGYIGGAAVAAGVGAAIAVSGQGTAHADTDGAKSASESTGPAKKTPERPNPAAKLEKRLSKLSDDVASAVKTPQKPKFDPSDAVKNLQKQFKATSAPAKSAATTPKTFKPLTDLAEKAAQAADSLAKLPKSDASVQQASIPWSPNPFRTPDPVPDDMPQPVWNLEQAVTGAFDSAPLVQPVVREGFEAGYRVSQMIPWVNVVVPLTNIAHDAPDAFGGDKDATQRIVNNLLVTTQPVSLLFYGYDQVADIVNLEAPAQDLKQQFYRTTWNVLDPFQLLHNRGQSGLPLSGTPLQTNSEAGFVGQLMAAYAAPTVTVSTDDPLSNPFRADDPWPTDMPDAVLGIEQTTVAALNSTPLAALSPLYREAFEAVYRGSQVVPWVNVPIPVTKILAALSDPDKSVPQTLINELLLTTQPVSALYYGYDEIADLLNVEDSAYELKQGFYRTIWDTVDPSGALHNVGDPGI